MALRSSMYVGIVMGVEVDLRGAKVRVEVDSKLDVGMREVS